MGKRSISRRYNLGTFAAVKPWRVGRELAVQDLPDAKVHLFFVSAILFQKNSLNLHFSMDQQNEPKIIRINILQTSMTLGTYLGAYIILAYIATLLTVKFTVLSLVSLPLLLGIPVVAFFLIRRFRDSTQAPFFPFPVSWMLSILTFLFATALSCMAAYMYLRFLDNGALAAGLTARMDVIMQSSQEVTAAMTDPAQVEQYNKTVELMQQTIAWYSSLPASAMTRQLIMSSLMWGNIISLAIGLLTAKRIKLQQ